MCFRDPYDALDVSTIRRLNGVLLEEATKKAEKRKAKEQAREQKRQEREQQRLAKAKARVEEKYGLRMQPSPSESGSGGSNDGTHSHRNHGHGRPSGDSERVPKGTGVDGEDALVDSDFGEFHSAPPPPSKPQALEVEVEMSGKAARVGKPLR